MAGVMFGNHLVLKFEPQKHRRRDGIVLRTGPGIAANLQNNTPLLPGRRLGSAETTEFRSAQIDSTMSPYEMF
jgi:hypothetical protein